MRRFVLLALVLSALVLGGTAGAAVIPNSKDRTFVVTAGHAGAAEIAAGKLALTKASDKATLAFARRMVHDHTMLATKLNQAAAAVGLTPPATPTPAQAAALRSLGKLSGSAFNAAYRKNQIAAHQAAVALFSSESKNGRAPTLKAAASGGLPTIEMHLKMAQDLPAY